MVYRETILESILKPWAQKHFKGRCWTFQPDSAPAHKARATQDWCKKNCPDFISSAEWPPSSPDSNPPDYSLWSILEAKACSTTHKSAESLRGALSREWNKNPNEHVRASVDSFIGRLKSCIQTKGDIFEK